MDSKSDVGGDFNNTNSQKNAIYSDKTQYVNFQGNPSRFIKIHNQQYAWVRQKR